LKQLKNILNNVALVAINGDSNVTVSGISIDSRKIEKGFMFIAINGVQTNGHLHIDKAIDNGATSIVCESIPTQLQENISYVIVENSSVAAALIACDFYEHPSQNLKLVGVTGTNGKTTIATVLFNLFTKLGFVCGLISTVENKIGDAILPSTHTTPDAISINHLLQQMVNAGCTYVFMECSSHAIHQQRITGLQFAGAIFSNITHDHLDYHKTFDEYIKVKKQFFDNLSATSFAITNLDDKRGEVMVQNTKATIYTYSLKTIANFKGKILDNSITGLQMLVNDVEVHFGLIGEFNAYNLLAIYGAATCLGVNAQEVLVALSNIAGAAGRFDYTIGKNKVVGIVDYAHTPDALENVLSTIKKLSKGNEQISTVVGCGGDRDKTKRPVMAAIAAKYSHRVLLTSDNPRTENPAVILEEMEVGLDSAGKRKSITIQDRKEAIKTAVLFANEGDIVLVAGKGHENYQEINGVKHPFDDKEILKKLLQ
jgi:UDP-N-acetylmuramoyl-L-alanyl-D-glutamate--2,6-diaminopimelate ligase